MPLLIRIMLLAAVFAWVQPVQPARAQTPAAQASGGQEKITKASLEALRTKVDAQAETYRRIDLAEQEALADNAPDKAKVFAEAKAKVYAEFVELNAQLQQVQMQKREQDRRDAASGPGR